VSQHTDTDTDDGVGVRLAIGVGSILAAGVIGLISTRRTLQRRRRRPGAATPMPTGDAATLEQVLRAAADPLSVKVVDRALRTLAQQQAHGGQPLPAVRAARLTAEQFELYLAEPATLPEPWVETSDQAVWILPAGLNDDRILDAETAKTVAAPYPSLVTVGHDVDDAHVFVDLEFLGTLGVTGAGTAATREVLAAIAVELATSEWADDLLVTIVGAYAELEDIAQTGRIRYLPSAGRVIDELRLRAEQDRDTLAAEQAADLNHARVTGVAPGIWTPEIVLLAGELTPGQRATLQELVDQLPRVAIAAVTSGEKVGDWELQLTGADTAVLNPPGIQLRPQRIPADTYAELLDLAATTHDDTEPDDAQPEAQVHTLPAPQLEEPEPDGLQAGTAPADDLDDDGDGDGADSANTEVPDVLARFIATPSPFSASAIPDLDGTDDDTGTADGEPAVADPAAVAGDQVEEDSDAEIHPMRLPAPRILVLGPVEIENPAGTVEPTKASRLRELAAYLALHPGANYHAIDAAIWPGARDNTNTRNTSMSKLRRWLGKDADGNDHMPRHSTAGYSLGDAVRTDWDSWKELIPGKASEVATDKLEAALGLIREPGLPFANSSPKRYAWAEGHLQAITDAIADAAYELARRRLIDGRWRDAERAAVAGLKADPAWERLWRVRIAAAHSAGNTAAVTEAVDRLLALNEQLGVDPEPETLRLLEQIKDPHGQITTAAL
jgi:DNA-binding SARP family transcriptional activator